MKYDVSNIIKQANELGDVAFNQGYEVSTEQLAANLEKQVEQLRDTINGSGLVDDAIESAHSREKAELQKALAERVDQLAQANLSVARKEDQLVYLRTEINRLNAMLERSNAQAQSSLAELTKANKRIADTLQQQLSAERVSYSDKRITQITQDKVELSHERDRLKSRAEIYKITAFTFGALWLVTLFCLIVILVG